MARNGDRGLQKLSDESLPSERIRAMQLDADGLLWIGTEAGAAVFAGGQLKAIARTESQTITAILAPGGGRAFMTSEQGTIFDCKESYNGDFSAQAITPADSPLLATDANRRAPLPLTSIAFLDNGLVVGTRSRGLLTIQNHPDGAP